jgi:cobalt-zinc-cadmium resistance protein CzcA
LNNQLAIAKMQYKQNAKMLTDFEVSTLKNADLIKEIANKQFINGEINYLDFVQLLNQSIAIESNYIDAIKTWNESVIQLNYLTTNN